MEKIENNKDKRIHKFYCDSCGKFLGSSKELPDCYFEKLGEYRQCFYVQEENSWYKLEKNLCDDCKNNFNKKLIEVLKK
jgi:hypothetical protein